jgi:hypothetical protein
MCVYIYIYIRLKMTKFSLLSTVQRNSVNSESIFKSSFLKLWTVLKKLIIEFPTWSSNFTSGYTLSNIESKDLNNYLCTCAHSSTPMFVFPVKLRWATVVDKWVDPQDMAYPYIGVFFILKKEWNSDTHYNIDELGRYAKWK